MGKFKVKFKGYLQDFAKFRNRIFRSEDFKTARGAMTVTLLNGAMIVLGIYAFKTSNLFLMVLGAGCGLFIYKKEIHPILTSLLNSFSLSKTYK